MESMNIHDPVLVINQCDTEDQKEYDHDIRIISTKERGLSKSRNLALKNAMGDICLLADEDETFVDGLCEKVLRSYEEFKDADVIAFKLIDFPTRLGNKRKRLKRFDALKVCSCQISFKRESVIDNNICFDEMIGSGTGNGAGEDNKFILECLKQGLKVYYVPVEIAKVAQDASVWFDGYDEKYFFNRGKTTGYILGAFWGFLYACYFIVAKRSLYKKDVGRFKAFLNILKGLKSKME